MKASGHMDYLLPFTSELKLPYRAKMGLKRKIDYLFRHPKFPKAHRERFIDVSTSGSRVLVNDMAIRAIALMQEFMDNPQQYGHNIANIEFQILLRMWRQVYKHCKLQSRDIDEYLGMKMVLLGVENGLWEELMRVVQEQDYIATGDSMVKQRKGVGLRDTKKPRGVQVRYGGDVETAEFRYLCSLE